MVPPARCRETPLVLKDYFVPLASKKRMEIQQLNEKTDFCHFRF
jgi:hypothetical protein